MEYERWARWSCGERNTSSAKPEKSLISPKNSP